MSERNTAFQPVACLPGVDNIGRRLCAALGLPPEQVVGFSLTFCIGQLVQATVEYLPTRQQAEDTITILKDYVLVRREIEDEDTHDGSVGGADGTDE